ncbi:hypothetical protein OZX60_06790 [Streptococcaceae bacterium ESL0687]|nr:hypothetical protein OZX60_06790 [Streptococcaceae bacterium ESL0687]
MDASSTAYVGSTSDLTSALANSAIDTIILTANIALGTGSFNVTKNITIDGQGLYTITYGGGSQTQGINFRASNITIHYKNVTFGFASAIGSHSPSNAGNYYGIAPTTDGRTNLTLIVENVTYNSDYGGQPFYLTGSSNKIVFSGTNVFNMMGGSYSQEFAEACNFVFTDNSSTTVYDNNTEADGFFWSAATATTVTIGDNASLVVPVSHHDFIYSGGGTPTITIGKNGTLSFKQATPLESTGQIITQTGMSPIITLGEGANLDLHSINTSYFVNLTMNMPTNSSAVFSSANNDSMIISGTANFNINDAARLLIEGGATSGKNNPITGAANINFNTFGANTLGYDSYINAPPSNAYTYFLPQTQPGTWSQNLNSSNVGTITRTGDANFTTAQVTSLKNSTFMSFTRQTPVTLSWASDGSDISTKAISLSTATDNAADYTGTFYWNDPGRFNNLMFRLTDSAGNQIGSDLADVITDGLSTYNSLSFTIPSSYLPVKSVNKVFYLKAFKQSLDGTETLKQTLTMNVTVDGMITLTGVPSGLSWTGRQMTDTKGVLVRDSGNTMALTTKDTRINQTGWEVTAETSGSAPFSLVWKEDTSATPVDIDGEPLFTNSTSGASTSTDANGSITSTKSWAENEGIQLKSDDYLTIGDHNGMTILWSVVDAP